MTTIERKFCTAGVLSIWMIAAASEGGEPTAAAQETPNLAPAPRTELTQLRNAWLMERKMALHRLDLGYEESLNALKERAAEAKDDKVLAAVEKEIRELESQFTLAKEEMAATVATVLPKPTFPKGKATLLAGRLVGKIWRVDHEGEGLRWYYFAEDGTLARKSRLTDWVWSGPTGTWRVDPRGVVEVRCEGSSAHVMVGEKGMPVIAINRQGVLSQRSLKETDLEYPGKGKE